jgi:hypothetical protein
MSHDFRTGSVAAKEPKTICINPCLRGRLVGLVLRSDSITSRFRFLPSRRSARPRRGSVCSDTVQLPDNGLRLRFSFRFRSTFPGLGIPPIPSAI